MEISDVFGMIFTLSLFAIVVLFEIHGFIVLAIPNGLFVSAIYLLGCLAGDSLVGALITLQ